MRNLAIITARSGSKGIKDKNIKLLAGMPMMAYSIIAAKNAGVFEQIMVSTDSEKYADIARRYGATVPFLRSMGNSNDTAKSWDVVSEVLEKYGRLNMFFDTVCLLQPTSPLRTSEDIKNGYTEFMEKGADAITSVCEVDHSPLWEMELKDDLSLEEFRNKTRDVPRQQMPVFYRLNGALYIRRVEYIDEKIVIQSKKEYAYIMDRERSIDIDSISDFNYAEYLMSKK